MTNAQQAAETGLDFMKMPVADLAKYHVVLETNQGNMEVEFWPDVAPNHVRNFLDLSYTGFYDGTTFHRVIPGFMIQGGDPTGTGTGDGKRKLKAEFNKMKHEPGVLSMARSQSPDSASCQFFVMHARSPHLDGQYSGFGKLVSGLEVVDKIAKSKTKPGDRPVEPQKILKARVFRVNPTSQDSAKDIKSAVDSLFREHKGAPENARDGAASLTPIASSSDQAVGGSSFELARLDAFAGKLKQICSGRSGEECARAIDLAVKASPTPRGLRIAGYSLAHAGAFEEAIDRLSRSIPGTADPVAVHETIAGCLLALGREDDGYAWANKSDRVRYTELKQAFSANLTWVMAVGTALKRPPVLGVGPLGKPSRFELIYNAISRTTLALLNPSNPMSKDLLAEAEEQFLALKLKQDRAGLDLACGNLKRFFLKCQAELGSAGLAKAIHTDAISII